LFWICRPKLNLVFVVFFKKKSSKKGLIKLFCHFFLEASAVKEKQNIKNKKENNMGLNRFHNVGLDKIFLCSLLFVCCRLYFGHYMREKKASKNIYNTKIEYL